MTEKLQLPFFEVGPKNLLRQPELRELLRLVEYLGKRERVTTIVTLPAVEIAASKRLFPGVLAFAQHMDSDRLGPSVGRVIAEALVDAGADGVLLNHSDRPLSGAEMQGSIERARETGLLTILCARDNSEALSVAKLGPDILLYEPPSLIGHSGGAARPWIGDVNAQVHAINPSIRMMHAGGIGTPTDARSVMLQGAQGTGATSAIVLAADRAVAVWSFLAATREGWDERKSAQPQVR